MSSLKKNNTKYTKKKKVWMIQRKNNKSTKIVHDKDQMVDLLDKDFKTTM